MYSAKATSNKLKKNSEYVDAPENWRYKQNTLYKTTCTQIKQHITKKGKTLNIDDPENWERYKQNNL